MKTFKLTCGRTLCGFFMIRFINFIFEKPYCKQDSAKYSGALSTTDREHPAHESKTRFGVDRQHLYMSTPPF